ncbi:MAG: MFS transporter [Lactobacillaceae bacterium]
MNYKNHARTISLQYLLISVLYAAGLGVWSGTIYIYMKHIHFTYGQINLFLTVFWITTFFSELPSGIIADTFGRLETVIVSTIIRAIGLLILTVSSANILILLFSAFLTGLGESLYSGAPDSWLVDKMQEMGLESTFGNIYSKTTFFTSITSLISGYIGANWLAHLSLKLPLIVGSMILLAIIPLLLIIITRDGEPKPKKKIRFHKINFKASLKSMYQILKEGLKEIKGNRNILKYLLAFLPITLIVTGPFNQWQLFFPTSGKLINTGNILIGINVMGIIGSYLAKYFLSGSKNKLIVLTILTFLNATTVILSVFFNRNYLSVIFLWLHILFVSSDEVSRYSVLQLLIKSKARSTLISLKNTLEAAMTIIALGINGFLSDRFGIGVAWVVLALVGGLLTLGFYFNIMLTSQKES